jgi:hypothetical protein
MRPHGALQGLMINYVCKMANADTLRSLIGGLRELAQFRRNDVFYFGIFFNETYGRSVGV